MIFWGSCGGLSGQPSWPSFRQEGVELEEKRRGILSFRITEESFIDARWFDHDDLGGQILHETVTGEGKSSDSTLLICAAKKLQELMSFLAPRSIRKIARGVARKEIDSVRLPGIIRYIGISISQLRSRDSETRWLRFNFPDLSDLRRLEEGMATQERMDALGRLYAACPRNSARLAAMAGASRNWRVSLTARRRRESISSIL